MRVKTLVGTRVGCHAVAGLIVGFHFCYQFAACLRYSYFNLFFWNMRVFEKIANVLS